MATSWFDVYHFLESPRSAHIARQSCLTGNRALRSDSSGTSPSFTRAINRLQGSDASGFPSTVRSLSRGFAGPECAHGEHQRQNCRNAQLVINAGSIATTAPAIPVAGTDATTAVAGTTSGTPLIAVANKTVQLTVANIQTQQLRGIVTAGGFGHHIGVRS